MVQEFIEKLESIPATIISGVFLVTSFVLPLVNINLFFNLAWVTIFISGLPLIYAAIKKLVKNKGISKISSALLISIAMIAAILIGDLFAAAEVAFIMALGEILEELTTRKAKKGLRTLISLAPTQGRKIQNGKESFINAAEILQGDILRIFPGERIPVDGIIINGETSIDQSIITGESIPVDKTVGEEVFCGTINRFGSIDIKATNVGEDSSLQRLIKMVKDAENKKAPMQRIADKWASILVPVALLVAIITLFVSKDINRAVTVLVVFCPCALVLATPTAIMAAIGQATQNGVIIKSGEALEKMGKVDTITFDKTGTITFGKLEVSDVICTSELSQEELIKIAASVESKSEHPLGKAIVDFSKKSNLQLYETTDFNMQTGKGVTAKIKLNSNKNENIIYCGNEKFFEENKFSISENIKNQIEELRLQGKASIIVGLHNYSENFVIGIIALSDILRPEVSSILCKLEKMKTESVLLTGDNEKTANYFSKLAGLKKVFANLLPEEKVQKIIQLQNEERTVCMIGDGVNDAPALKTADVGISMGKFGSDIAIEASDIALMSDDISKLPYLKKLSVATVKTIKFSIFLSMFINFLGIILSVLGLLNPTTGALVHNAGSVFVVMIAALLYEIKFDK